MPMPREELRSIPLFEGVPDEQLDWFAERSWVVEYREGEVVACPGDPAGEMWLLLDGEVHAYPAKGLPDEGSVYVWPRGEVSGMLPFSRMTRIPRLVRAAVPTRVAFFPATLFPEMLDRMPELEPRLVAILSDRIRQTTRAELQGDRLRSLGRLFAGLAHELNNPATAALRAAGALRDATAELGARTASLGPLVGEEVMRRVAQLCRTLDPQRADGLSTLERGDREEEITAWLDANGVEESWRLAPTFVSGGLTPRWLDGFAALLAPELLPAALAWVEVSVRTDDLLRTVEQSSERISTLVAAVKDYTFVDRAPVQEVDVHAALESTLRVLAHKLDGVTLVRRFAAKLPRVVAYGGELNQMWSNLIDNAADAAGPGGRVELRTASEGDAVTVEVRDDGPGIPPEVQPRIFDPFFTTKEVGKGTGLGLDIVRRVVDQHQGSIRVDSRPGCTRFIVRLPLAGPPEPVLAPLPKPS